MPSTEKSRPPQEEADIPYWRLITDNGYVDNTIATHECSGDGTEESPYLVEWLPGDARNPLNWSMSRKVAITLVVALSSLSVAFCSSAYLSPASQLEDEFDTDIVTVTLGIFTYNMGQAAGPVLWGPLSELYGRQAVFLGSFLGVTLFNGGCTASQSIAALVVLRLFAGLCASSPLTNAGGIIADMFPISQRGLAMSAFIVSPYLGPAIGPIVSGFLAAKAGWRWVMGLMTLFTGSMLLLGAIVIPETYAPFLLSQRAKTLSARTDKVYRDTILVEKGPKPPSTVFKQALGRPWLLLFREPIISLLSVYMALIYGVLYSFFGAFPIVYQEVRGWSQGLAGLAFVGVAIGMILGVFCAAFVNIQYRKLLARGEASPEKRLIPAMIGSILVPVSLFWWAFTTYPSINAIASIAAGVPFATGMVLTYLAVTNYVIDSYGVYAASALAANAVLRCSFGAFFPLFTPAQYRNLGIHWAAALMGFLALACAPFPWVFSKYGKSIRQRCKYSAEAERLRSKITERQIPNARS